MSGECPAVNEGGKALLRKLETGENRAGRSRLAKGPAGRRIEYRKCRRLFSTQIHVRADAAPAVLSIREWRKGKWRKGIGLGRICRGTGLGRDVASPYFLINVKIGKVIDPGRFRRTMYGITPNRGYADFPVGRHRPLEIGGSLKNQIRCGAILQSGKNLICLRSMQHHRHFLVQMKRPALLTVSPGGAGA